MHSLRARDAVEQKHEVNKNKNTTMYAYSIKLLACATCMDNRKYAHGVPTVNSGPIYDNAKVTIDLRRSSGLQNIFPKTQGTIHLKNRKIISDIVCKFAYDILNRNLITF